MNLKPYYATGYLLLDWTLFHIATLHSVLGNFRSTSTNLFQVIQDIHLYLLLICFQVDEETRVSHIQASKILARSDKQPDRVEISPEQLTDACSYAEELSKQWGKTVRVLGWYHSHPHITVMPSDVDLRTQSMYQNMDKFFVGLIFSVFNGSKGLNEIQVICFQTHVQRNSSSVFSRLEITYEINPVEQSFHALSTQATLPLILDKEEQEQKVNENATGTDNLALLQNLALENLRYLNTVEKVRAKYGTLEVFLIIVFFFFL